MTDHARFVSVARFADIVGLSERGCWTLIRDGIIPVYRVRRRTLIKVEEGCEAFERFAVQGHNDAS